MGKVGAAVGCPNGLVEYCGVDGCGPTGRLGLPDVFGLEGNADGGSGEGPAGAPEFVACLGPRFMASSGVPRKGNRGIADPLLLGRLASVPCHVA